MQDIDLENIERRDRNYEELNKLIDGLQRLSVFPTLTWLYVWDIVKDKLDYYHADSGEECFVNPKLTEKDVFDLFWEDADVNGFTLEYGPEGLHEAVFEWMLGRGILRFAEEDEQLTLPLEFDTI